MYPGLPPLALTVLLPSQELLQDTSVPEIDVDNKVGPLIIAEAVVWQPFISVIKTSYVLGHNPLGSSWFPAPLFQE